MSGNLKIVYTDYEYAIVFVCEHGHYDSSCYAHQADVTIMSRHQLPIPAQTLAHLHQTLRGICYEPGDFIPLRFEGKT